MPFALPAAASAIAAAAPAAAASAATATAASTFTTLALNVATNFAISAVMSALQPQVGVAGRTSEWTLDPDGPIPFAAGRVGVPGSVVYRKTFGPDLMYYGIPSVLSGAGPIDGYEAVRADEEVVTFDSTGKAISSQYAGELWYKNKLGAQPDTALASPAGLKNNAALPGWGSSHKLSGKACYLLVMGENSKGTAFPTGEVKPIITFRGLKGWDPRLDSTYPGGSGPCRLNDPSTWVYLKNPILWALKWCLGLWEGPTGKGAPQVDYQVGGIGAKLSGIDVPAFVAAANVSDANDWTVAAYPTTDDGKAEVLDAFLQAGGAIYAQRAGKISCIQRAAPRTSIVTISADTAGPLEIDTAASRIDRINTIRPRFWSEANRWQLTATTEVSATAYRDEDGAVRPRGIDYPYVTSAKQASQLAALQIANTREGIAGVIPLKPHLQRIRPGDAFTITEQGFVLNGLKCLCLSTDYNPADGIHRVTFVSETDQKYPFALGQSPIAPEPPVLTPVDPRYVGPPLPGDWVIVVRPPSTNGGQIPGFDLTGIVSNDTASDILVEYGPTAVGPWKQAYDGPPTVTNVPIDGLQPGQSYYVAVSYIRNGNTSERQVYGPYTAPDLIADDTNNLGGEPAAEIVARLATAEGLVASTAADVADLEDIYGDTVSAAASASAAAADASAAAAAQAAAIIAKGNAETAATTSTTKAGQAVVSATNAATSATNAAGSATTATTQAGLAAGSATAAGGSASAANTSAGAAATSATNAGNSATASQTSRLASESARDAAQGSATAASTSASNASTSATAAGTSATAANTSATNAATKAGEASTSATAASGSATDALGSKNAASLSATAAATSATAAGGSATAAAGSASTASTAASDAGNSASAAAVASVSAASSYSAGVAAVAMTIPERIGATGEWWSASFAGYPDALPSVAGGKIGSAADIGPVFQTRDPDDVVFSKGAVPITDTDIYEVTVEIEKTSGPTVTARAYGRALNGAFGAVGGGLPGPVTAYSISGPIIIKRLFARASAGVTGDYTALADGAWLRPGVQVNRSAAATTQVRRISVENVTARVAAEVNAAAAVTSASQASTSAGAAGASATASAASATTASTKAGDASTFAGQASTSAGNAAASSSTASTAATTATGAAGTAVTQASNASASAQSASFSANVAASLGTGGGLVNDPTSQSWPVGQALPANVVIEGTGQTVLRDTSSPRYPPATMRITATTAANSGVKVQSAGLAPPAQMTHVVFSYEITLISGILRRAGMIFRNRLSSGDDNIALLSLNDQHGNGVVGRSYRGEVLAPMSAPTSATPDLSELFLFSNHDSLSGSAASKAIQWHLYQVRPATPEEIAANEVIPALEAQASITAGAVADLEDQVGSAFIRLVAASGGNPASFELASSSGGSAISLLADKIGFGANTSFDDATDQLRTTIGTTRMVTAWGAAFGASPDAGELTYWEGASSVSLTGMTRANARFFRANTAPYFGGTEVAAASSAPKTASVSFNGNAGYNTAANTAGTTPAIVALSGDKFSVDVSNVFASSDGSGSSALAIGTLTLQIGKGGTYTNLVTGVSANTSVTALPGQTVNAADLNVEVSPAYAGNVTFRIIATGGGPSTQSKSTITGKLKATRYAA